MSDSFRDKLGGYLNDELEELKFLRSVSPYAYSIGSRSPRRQSRSPRPNKIEHSPPPTTNLDSRLCSAPDIAAWPAPTTSAIASSKPTSSKPVQIKPPTIITTSLSPTPCQMMVNTALHKSPYASPQPSPIPHSDTSHISEESTKLLAMLKVVAASSPGGHNRHESELRQKIQTLEETVAEYEKQKYNVMGTFKDYGERVAERERKLEAEYSSKIIALSEEVLGAKKDFETRMKSFQALQEQFEREKEQALEKLRQEHQKEIQVLEQRFSQSQLLNLEQKYIIEIQRLEEERKSLRTEKERLGETFEMKLRRAQSLYETELTAAKMLYTKELEALRDHEDALKDELAARQDEFHDRLQEIQHQAKHSKDEMNNCKNEVALLERKLRKKELEVQNISRELSTARTETNEAFKKLTAATSDLEGIRKEYNDQKAEFDRKLKLLTAAETARRKLESTIRELQIEVKALKNKVDFLEMERDNLQSQSESQTQLHNSQVQALEAVLESVTKEKETTKEHYERLLEKEREQAEEREYSIKQEFSTKLNELEDQYNALREHIEQSDSFGPENVKLWEEIECLRSEKSILEDEVTGLKTQLTSSQQIAEAVGESENMSLDYVIELLRAIDVVKKKVLKSRSQSSSRASENPEEMSMTTRHTDCAENNHECTEDCDDELEEEENSSQKQKVVEIAMVIKQLKELESSVNEIIMEKDEAKSKVEQLGEENKILMEKLEYFKSLNSDAFSRHGEDSLFSKTLEEYRARIGELEKSAQLANETHEKTMEEERLAMEEKMDEEMARLKEELASDKETDELRRKMTNIEEEKRKLEEDVVCKAKEIKEITKKANEYLRKKEEEKSLEMEQKIISLNKEHEKTIELIRQHEAELNDELEKARQAIEESNSKAEKQEDQTQTESDLDHNGKETEKGLSENSNLERELHHLQNENEKKDALIKDLQEQIDRQRASSEFKGHDSENNQDNQSDEEQKEEFEHMTHPKAKKDRSQSMVGNTEHLAMCQKAASRFHNLVSQMTEKRSKNLKLTDGSSKNSKQYTRERLGKDHLEVPGISSPSSPSGSWMTRAKSPCYLSPLRESSPLKLRLDAQDNMSSTSSTHRSLLSPSDIDVGSRRSSRVSPSRQMFFGKSAYDKSEKRPAWKF